MNTRTLLLGAALLLTSLTVPAGEKDDQAMMTAIRTYCGPDIQRLCPNVVPGGGRIKDCLMKQKNQMSVGCAQALQKLKEDRKGG